MFRSRMSSCPSRAPKTRLPIARDVVTEVAVATRVSATSTGASPFPMTSTTTLPEARARCTLVVKIVRRHLHRRHNHGTQ
jgi:hypothetical protein